MKSTQPKFGLLTNPANNILSEIKTIKKLKFDFVEIGIEEPEGAPKKVMKEKSNILKNLRGFDLGPIGHTAYWVQFGSSHEKVREGWVREAREMVDVAVALKIKFLNFHFHGGEGQTLASKKGEITFIENFAKSLKEVSNYAKSRKISVMLENVPTAPNRSYGIKEYSYVLRKVPDVWVHFDVGHAFIEGGMSRVKDYITKFSKRITHIHIHDNHGMMDEHLPLGDGTIDFVKVVRWLRKINYKNTITLEVFTSPYDAAMSREYLKKLWRKTSI